MLDQILSVLFRFLAGIACVMSGAIVVLITIDVVGRNLGLGNLPWLTEVVEYALYILTFLAAPWVLRLGSHVRMNLLSTLLPRRLALVVDVLANTAGFAVCVVLIWFGYAAADQAMVRGSLMIKTLIFPEWWLLAVMPFSLLLLALEYVLRLSRLARGQAAGLQEEAEVSGAG
ncbi:MAG TPA: TRAP transporter small permease [Alphaproteobacteria bacterium]|nr:TRAP transporter small permease [Alphaproteobacteria bacterium]